MPQQTTTPPPPATTPTAPQPFVVRVTPAEVPQTTTELRALRAKRSQLSDQLVSAADRRKNLAEQLKTADGAARRGLEQRIQVLDQRIVRLEQDIDQTGDALANAPASVLATAGTAIPQDFLNQVSSDLVPIIAILSVFVFAPIAITISRFIWKRGNAPPRAVPDHATMQRLEQLQQAVDTIAIEVERISEGQRFVTRVLSEKPGIGSGAAESVRQAKAGVPQER